ncbi:TetR/AcrR family transcriptional regulator [Amycolatopsis sp. 195334CR]|uniref:TetR/AcrR family transcriptional regulator n=1 Tax=Amycolatopsis sp. 195334CR TaxID=2814588 RepID=UPI001A8D99E0|nr:TetR/AcrR family transcriptional regulator [Amycolatopsis sp. 195334CR]MBN6041314.1 TetR/AcrR family transcriptional regulator [Amycolatopsis sp. 195334CR]
MTPRRTPTGAAVLQPRITSAIAEAVLDELAANGYGRLSMEAVAKRAGVGKSALYRRWPSKQDMVIAVLSEFSVPLAVVADTGSLRGDLLALVDALRNWFTHPHFSAILPDITAEAGRNPALAAAIQAMIGQPRREQGAVMLRRAIARGELPADLNMEMALDFLPGPLFWRLSVRKVALGSGYEEELVELLLRAMGFSALATE